MEEAKMYEIVLVRGGEETSVYSGLLEDCEDWLALNGDTWNDGHFEIRPTVQETVAPS